MKPILLLFCLFLVLINTGIVHGGEIECNGETWTTDGIGDQEEINEAIREGDTVYLSGDFCINDPIILDSDTILDGQGQTTITIPDNVNRISSSEFYHKATKGYATVMVPFIKATNCENIEITGIHFDGNADGLSDLITGRGFFNFIMPTGCNGISVHDCSGENSLGDFLRPIKSTNIKFYNIEAERLGHEALFAIRSSNIEMYGCKINCRINNAFRIRGSDNAYIHDNYITCTAKESAGPGGQVDVIENQEMNVEICNNVFVSTGGPGLWIVGDNNNYDEDLTDIKIHHNAFLNTGWDGRDWQGGVLTSVVHNVEIYNNVFDGCSNAGIVTYRVKGLPVGPAGADFTVTVQDNIITNTHEGRNSGSGVGYGLSNTLSQSHNIISSGNVLWENAGGNYNKCIGDDLIQDPKLDPANTGWRWTGSAWECDYVSAEKTVWDSSVEVDEEIEDEDYEPVPEREFDSIIMEFTESGYLEQGDIRPVKNWEKKGKYTRAYIFLAGYDGEIKFNNQSYIPKPASECALVQYEAKNLAKYPTDQETEIKLTDNEDGSLIIDLKVKTKYKEKEYKTYKILGRNIKISYWEKKSETVHYTQTYPAPPLFPELGAGLFNVTVQYYNTSYNPYTLVTVQENEKQTQFSELITFIEYKYKTATAKEFRQIGYISKNTTGYKKAYFKETNTWKIPEGELSHSGRQLYISGPLDLNALEIIVHTPYAETKVTDISYTEVKESTSTFFEKMKQLFWILLFFVPFIFSILEEFKIVFGRFRG